MGDREREYLVRILLVARDQITQVVQKATDAVNQLTGAQEKSTEASMKASQSYKAESTELGKLVEAHIREKKSIADKVKAINELADARKKSIDALKDEIDQLNRQIRTERAASQARSQSKVVEISELRAAAAQREENIGKIDKEVKALRRQAATLQANATLDAASSRKSIGALGEKIAASRNHIEVLKDEEIQLRKMSVETDRARSRFTRFATDVRRGARDTDLSLAQLAASFRGFQIAFVIKYAQALLSALVGLGGALLAVAGNAVQAGVGLAAGLAAGAAQALPIVALLTTALLRVTAVMKVVKLANDQQLVSGRDAEAAAERQRSAAESIRNAREAEADASRDVADAQRELNDARADGARQLQDLMDAERGAVLTLDEAQAALRQAISTGDAGSVARAQLDVRGARRGLGRAREDRAAVGGHVENLPEVEAAVRRVEDAERAATQASRNHAEARRAATVATDQQTAATDRLQQMLAELSPAERRLYESVLAFQRTFKRVFTPVTDIIVDAFADGIDRARRLLLNDELIADARTLAEAVAKELRRAFDELGSGESIGFFRLLTREAARNLPQVGDVLVNVFRTARNLIRAALPAFRLLLDYIEEYSEKARDASEDTDSISKVFVDGVKYARAWFDLALAAVDLFAALTGAGGGETGFKIIEDATKGLERLADQVRENADGVRAFFDDSRFILGEVARVLEALARAIADVFSTRNIGTFADFLVFVVIPAITATVEVMGFLTSIAHALLAIPIVRDVAAWAATFLILAKGLLILHAAMVALRVIALTFLATFGLIPALILAAVTAIILLDKRLHFLAPTLKFIQKVAKDVFDWLKTAAGDVFEAVKEPAADVIEWFRDVWSKGLLKWMRFPFEWFIEHAYINLFKWLYNTADDVIAFFKGDKWSSIGKVIAAPFKVMWKLIKPFVDIAKEGIGIFLDLIAGRFERIGGKIANIWYRIFSTMHAVMVDVLNTIVSGVNTAIGAFNQLPFVGDKIGKIELNLKKMPVSRIAAETLELAKQGKSTSSFAGPNAAGGMHRATPGGRLALITEGGFDEVILTTDPKHAGRQKNLLEQYLKRMAPHFAEGGWTQGAVPTQPGRPITGLANALFKRGFFATSGYRSSSTTHHGAGDAVDFGDSVNNMRALWRILYPLRRGLTELGGPSSVSRGRWFNNGAASDIRGTELQRDHEDHIHVAMVSAINRLARRVGSALGGNVGAAAGLAVQLPAALQKSVRELIGRNPAGRTGGFASAGLGAVYQMAARAIRGMKEAARDGTASVAGGEADLSGISGGVARSVFQVGKRLGAPFKHLLAAMMTGIVESGMRNLSFGDADSVGWRQERLSIYGPSARNVLASARRFFQETRQFDRGQSAGDLAADVQRPAAQYRGRYEDVRARALALLRRLQRGGKFAFGGAVPGFGGGDVHPRWLEGGEHVLTKGEVQAAGGHVVIRELRRMLGGGGQGGQDGFQVGGEIPVAVSSRRQTDRLPLSAGLLEEIAKILGGLDVGKAKGSARRLRLAFERIFEAGGPIEQLRLTVERITERVAQRIQRAQFVVSGGVGRRRVLEPTRIGQLELGGLQRTRVGLTGEADVLDQALGTAQAELAEARARGSKEAVQQAKAEIRRVRDRQRDVNALLVQNAQDIVEKQEEIQQALADAVESDAQRRNDAIDRATRLAAALGRSFSPAEVLGQQISVMQDQISGLGGVLDRARRTGNAELARSTEDKIAELQVAIAEATAQQFQAQIDAVNASAASGLASTDRRQRLAQIGGTNFAAVGAALTDRGFILGAQRAGLVRLQEQAIAAGNVQQVNALGDAIMDLDVTIAENTQAVIDNTDAATADRISRINEQAGFTTGVFSSVSTFFTGLASLTGQPQTAALLSALTGTGTALQNQRRGLAGELGGLLGFQGAELLNLLGLSGTDLVNFLLSISTGPAFDSIMSRLNPTQQTQFKDLITALLGNANAVQDNTKAVQDLTGQTNVQDWNSTFWQRFRSAVFTGVGGVLPQYQIPGLGITPSALMTEPGQTTTTTSTWGGGGGVQMTNNFVRTDPDPLAIARTLEWHRKLT